jgi:hypothetical protein
MSTSRSSPAADEVSTSFKSEADGTLTAYQEQDVEPFLEAAKAHREASGAAGSRYKRTFTLAARVPNIVLLQIRNKYGIDATKALSPTDRRKFYSIIQSEYPALLCVPGKPFGN